MQAGKNAQDIRSTIPWPTVDFQLTLTGCVTHVLYSHWIALIGGRLQELHLFLLHISASSAAKTPATVESEHTHT